MTATCRGREEDSDIQVIARGEHLKSILIILVDWTTTNECTYKMGENTESQYLSFL
jgi:hypothetical protein